MEYRLEVVVLPVSDSVIFGAGVSEVFHDTTGVTTRLPGR